MSSYSNSCETQTNETPFANAGPDQSVGFLESVTLDGSSSTDPDGAIQGFQWAQLSGEMVTLSNEDQPTTSFVSPAAENILIFSLTVSDDGGSSGVLGQIVARIGRRRLERKKRTSA